MRYLISIFLLAFTLDSYSQVSQTDCEAIYKSADSLFKSGNYSLAIKKISAYKICANTTNIKKADNLLLKIYVEVNAQKVNAQNAKLKTIKQLETIKKQRDSLVEANINSEINEFLKSAKAIEYISINRHLVKKLDLSKYKDSIIPSTIQYFDKLDTLVVGSAFGNSSLDLSNIRLLRNLRFLRIMSRGISSIDFLDNCKSLEVLEVFDGSKVKYWTFNQHLKKTIRILKISLCRSLDGVGELRNIEVLDIQNSPQVSNIEQIEKLFGSLIILNMRNCNLKKMIPLQNMTKLNTLVISNNIGIERVETISSLKNNLTKLDISKCGLKNLMGISELMKIELLNISDNELENLLGIEKLHKLSELSCGNNPFNSINSICELHRSLQKLSINNCKIINLHEISCLIELKSLNIASNEGILRWEVLNLFEKLDTLDISNCNIDSLSKISNINRITSLNLSGCKSLKNLDAFKQFKRLKNLDLSDCNLPDLDFLIFLPNNVEVKLYNNKNITDDAILKSKYLFPSLRILN